MLKDHNCPHHVIADGDIIEECEAEGHHPAMTIPSWRTLALVMRFLQHLKKKKNGVAVKYQRQIDQTDGDQISISPVTIINTQKGRQSGSDLSPSGKRPTLIKVGRQLTMTRLLSSRVSVISATKVVDQTAIDQPGPIPFFYLTQQKPIRSLRQRVGQSSFLGPAIVVAIFGLAVVSLVSCALVDHLNGEGQSSNDTLGGANLTYLP